MNEMNDDYDPGDTEHVAPFVLTGPVQGRRVLSGIQPSGTLHLGNYFGAIAQHLLAQHDNECMYFIADYHALTTVRDGAELRRATRDVALDYLALGLNPTTAALYRQHDVVGVTQLAWILGCLCSMGDLDRSVSYKDKIGKGIAANLGLYSYPVLMAADILIVNAEVVPVGQDQLQNIELARRLAARFNQTFGVELFEQPLAQVNAARVVPGLDGAKMSKSYGNTVPIFATPAEYKRLVASIKTDSLATDDPKDPTICSVYALLSLLVDPAERDAWAARYSKGGLRYSDIKKRLVGALDERFGPAMALRADLAARPDDVEDILRAGAIRASRVAQVHIDRVFELVGLGSAALSTMSASTGIGERLLAQPTRGWN